MERFEGSRTDGRCSAPAEVLTRHPLQGGVCERRACVREHVVARVLALNEQAKEEKTLAYVNALS